MTTEEDLKKLLEADLKKIVSLYAKWDPVEKAFIPKKLDKNALLKLGDQFYKLLDGQLLANGAVEAPITKKYKKMTLYFHMDRKAHFFPEVTWLEENLSESKNDGSCFRILSERHQKLITPEQFQDSSFQKVNTKKEFRIWIEHLQVNASSFSSRCFAKSLLDLYDQSDSFFDEVGKIKPKGLKTLIGFIPIVFGSYGAIICGTELFALYALYFVLLKGGQKIGQSDFAGALELGNTIHGLGTVGAAVTAVFMMRLLQMTFWVSHRSYKGALQIGATLITPLLTAAAPAPAKPASHSSENWRKDLILAKQDVSKGTEYRTPEFKLISAPFESYLYLNGKQWFASARSGAKKRTNVEAFLFNLRVLDKGNGSLQAKLTAVQKELAKIKNDKVVYESTTAAAVDCAEDVINSLLEPEAPSTQLVVAASAATK